jgi:hypothetical protein
MTAESTRIDGPTPAIKHKKSKKDGAADGQPAAHSNDDAREKKRSKKARREADGEGGGACP